MGPKENGTKKGWLKNREEGSKLPSLVVRVPSEKVKKENPGGRRKKKPLRCHRHPPKKKTTKTTFLNAGTRHREEGGSTTGAGESNPLGCPK